jgi:hypothetical protein
MLEYNAANVYPCLCMGNTAKQERRIDRWRAVAIASRGIRPLEAGPRPLIMSMPRTKLSIAKDGQTPSGPAWKHARTHADQMQKRR